jgi:hypothetical protein
MPLGSVTYEDKALKACYGDTRSSEWPASFTMHLYDGHPLDGGAELTSAGGYAAITVANTSANFPVVDGEIDGPLQAFPVSTAAWSDTGRWVVLKSGATLVEFWRLARGHRVNITAAGQVARVPVQIWHNDIEIN